MKALKDFLKNDYRRKVLKASEDCCQLDELIGYAGGNLTASRRDKIESHISNCYHCLDAIVSIGDGQNMLKRKKGVILKVEYLYLTMAIICFILSFTFSEYFLQLLTATIILGTKWIIDSKTTKTLITIRKAIEDNPASNIKNRLKSEKIL